MGGNSRFLNSRFISRFSVIVTILCLGPRCSLDAWAQQAQASSPAQAPAPAQPKPPAAVTAAVPAVAPDEVVLSVGDTKITAAEFDRIAAALPPDAAGALASLGRRGFAERYAGLLSLAKVGEKRKVDQNEEFKQMAAFQRLMLLAQATLNDIVTTMDPISPEQISTYYAQHQSDYQQVKTRGIYIAFGDSESPTNPEGANKPADKSNKPKLTEEQAKAKAESLRKRIQAGESMEALAKTESDHASASKGGDLGFVRRNQFSSQIDNVLFALEPKQVSAPVKDRFGYFIFQVEEKRTQPLDEMKSNIENNLRQQKVGELLAKAQNEYPPALNPKYFGEAPVIPGFPPTAAPSSSSTPAPAATAK